MVLNRTVSLAIVSVLFVGCTLLSNGYESASSAEREGFKKVRVPLLDNTRFTIVQGAFGQPSHSLPGESYSWDFGVSIGTPVVAAEAGKVIGIWEPYEGGGCDSKFLHFGHYIRVRHRDGTIAQYVHVKSEVQVGEEVEKGERIAVTAKNGWLCVPHLHFGVYRSVREINSPKNKTIPVCFEGVPGGILRERGRYRVRI